MIIGPFTVSRGSIVPYTIEHRTPQKVRIAGDGSVTVVERAYTNARFFRVKIRVDKDEASSIASFLVSGVGYRRQTFSFTDGYGDVFTVRYWDDTVRERAVVSGVVELDLLFRREVVAP